MVRPATFLACPARRRTATTAAVVAASLTLVAAVLPAPAPLGIGDRLFPHLGNPGYDVISYDIAFRYTGNNTEPLQAHTKIAAEVTAGSLPRFNLDFAGGKVGSVRVNGEPATHTAAGEDLVVTPATPVRRGTALRVSVRHTSPTAGAEPPGWVRTRDGLVMANQADAAHRVFPGNDHPSDKARFTFRVTAPERFTAVANGLATGTVRKGGEITWSYRTEHPMATELAQVSVGRSAVVRRDGPPGVELRDVVPAGRRAALEPVLARTPAHVAWMEERVGRYPFESYGVLVADARLGFALETQTLSLVPLFLMENNGNVRSWERESVMVHELAHQWFGDSVSPHRWTDLWLNEGHATWYGWLYAAEHGGDPLRERVRRAYGRSDEWRKEHGPPAALREPRGNRKISIFTPIVYDGSAVVLYALRQKIGERDFERLQRVWVAEHRDSVASTADFIALASRISGRDLSGFLTAWLYGEKTPPMPGHPSWRQAKPAAGR